MQAHPEVAAVTGNIVVGEGAQGQEPTYLERCGMDFGGKPWVILDRPFEAMLRRDFMANPATMARRDCLLEVGGIDESLRLSSDWDLYLRMARCHIFDGGVAAVDAAQGFGCPLAARG